jgi:hypothetical protein
VLARLRAAAGQELQTGKLFHEESSAALAVNTFGWFLERPKLLPQLPGAPVWEAVTRVDVEYCARFPWTGGRHPWLDAIVETPANLIGIESKRFEPFRDRKSIHLSPAYDRPVWGDGMRPFERMRDAIRDGTMRFELLDAAQLVKHAFGLVTDGRRKEKRPHLHYLYAEPNDRRGIPISAECKRQHRTEVQQFANAAAGAEVTFSECSYREWLTGWLSDETRGHASRIIKAFAP